MPPIYRTDPLRDMSPWGRGPIWIDPNYYYYRRYEHPWKITPAPRPLPQRPAPVDEERIRKIVREEIANLPIKFDVPDAPPADG